MATSPSSQQPSLYDVLDVDRTADMTAIRRAYYRKAITLHPDRAGTQATAEFQQLQRAYETLGDPVKRRAYDRYGDAGLQMVEQGDYGPLLQTMGVKAMLSTFAFASCYSAAACLAQLVVLTVRFDDERSWSWWSTLVPTWVLVLSAVIAVFVFVAVSAHNAVVDGEGRRVLGPLLMCACVLLVAASSIMVAIALEDGTFGALVALAPLIVLAFGFAVYGIPQAVDFRKHRELLHINTGVEPSTLTVLAGVVSRVVLTVLPLATLLLIGLRADKQISGVHFFVCAAPLCVASVVDSVSNWLFTGLVETAGEMNFGQRVCGLLLGLLQYGVILAGCGLVSEKLETEGDEPSYLGVCFIPWFAFGMYVMCGTLFLGLALAGGAKDDLTTLEELQRQEDALQRASEQEMATHRVPLGDPV